MSSEHSPTMFRWGRANTIQYLHNQDGCFASINMPIPSRHQCSKHDPAMVRIMEDQAEFILRVLNNHEKLVEALRDLCALPAANEGWISENGPFARAKAVLASLERQEGKK